MAFQPDRPLCFSSMGHLNPDTLRFATLLREGPPVGESGDEWKQGLSEEEVKILEEEGKKKKAERKIKPCTVKKCKDEEKALQLAILEGVLMRKKMDEISLQLQACEEDMRQLDEANLQITAEVDQDTVILADLRHKEKHEVKERMIEANRLKHATDISILKANAEIANINESNKEEEATATRQKEKDTQGNKNNKPSHFVMPDIEDSSLNFDVPTKALPPKHTGKYEVVASGFHQWSCCMADDHDHDGCADDQSVGVRSALIHKGAAAHKPYHVRQEENAAALREKKDLIHKPVVYPPQMNKGFRDVRQSHHNYSYYSKNHGEFGASHLEIAQHAHMHQKQAQSQSQSRLLNQSMTQSGSAVQLNSASKVDTSGASLAGSRSSKRSGGSKSGFNDNDIMMAGSMDSSGSYEDHDQATTSLVFLHSSLAMTNSIIEQKKARTGIKKGKAAVAKPSTAGAFPMTGSMRIGQTKILSGNFPEFTNVDLALVHNPGKDYGVARSDIANAKTQAPTQILDSASLLANYANSKGSMKAVGAQRRHLGLSEMKRRGGRPLTSNTGPHLRTTSTVGKATSFAHVMAKQC